MEPDIATELNAYQEGEFFNPEFVEVDRVLDIRIVLEDLSLPLEDKNNPDLTALLAEEEHGRRGAYTKEFLIKWNSLGYNEITWEIFDDFQDSKSIAYFYKHQ